MRTGSRISDIPACLLNERINAEHIIMKIFLSSSSIDYWQLDELDELTKKWALSYLYDPDELGLMGLGNTNNLKNIGYTYKKFLQGYDDIESCDMTSSCTTTLLSNDINGLPTHKFNISKYRDEIYIPCNSVRRIHFNSTLLDYWVENMSFLRERRKLPNRIPRNFEDVYFYWNDTLENLRNCQININQYLFK